MRFSEYRILLACIFLALASCSTTENSDSLSVTQNSVPVFARGSIELSDDPRSAVVLSTIAVRIEGCVVSPGAYELPKGTTLGTLLDRAKLIASDGYTLGEKPHPRPSKTNVVRKGKGDSRVRHTLDAREKAGSDRDFELADGDYV